MSEKIQIVVTAKDNASRELKALRGNIKALGTKTGGPLGGLIGGFAGLQGPAILAGVAIGSVVKFLADGVQSAIAEEKSLAALDTALQANVKNWDGNRDSIDEATRSLQLLGFEDDAARSSMGKLVIATGDVEDAMRLQGLAADIARGRNIDLAAATDLVLKANMGNVGALRRMGIQIDKAATSTEILAQLQQSYGGQAEAYAETTEGAMQSAQIAIGEVAEEIGIMLLPAIKDAALWLRDDLVPALQATIGFIGDAAAEAQKLADIFNELAGPKGPAGELEPRLEELGALHGTIFDEMGDGLSDYWGGFISLLRDVDLALGTRKASDFVRNSRGHWVLAGEATGEGFLEGVTAGMGEPDYWQNAGSAVADGVATGVRSNGGALFDAGGDIMGDLAGGIRGAKDLVATAMDDIKWAILNPMAGIEALANIEGGIAAAEYAAGLAEGNQLQTAIINQQRDKLLAMWKDITGYAYEGGRQAAQAYSAGLQSSRGRIPAPYIPGFLGGYTPGGVKHRAAGGPVGEGETYMVGERGPEMVTFGAKGNVTPNHAMGGGPIVVNVDGRELFRILDSRQGRALSVSTSAAYVRG